MRFLKEHWLNIFIGFILAVITFFVIRPNYLDKQQEKERLAIMQIEEVPVISNFEDTEIIKTHSTNYIYEAITEEEYYDSLELLALLVEAEAGNQDLYGKRLVVDVVLNRVEDPAFPNDIESVILDPGQFSVVDSGAIYNIEPSDETFDAVILELYKRSNYDVLYFNSKGFTKHGNNFQKVGNHYFSTKK